MSTIAAIATAWLVWRFRGRTRLAYSFLAQGLILLILAVPIQFKGMWVPYFWALEALIAIVAARGTRNRMTLAAGPIMLALAFIHFGLGHAVKENIEPLLPGFGATPRQQKQTAKQTRHHRQTAEPTATLCF